MGAVYGDYYTTADSPDFVAGQTIRYFCDNFHVVDGLLTIHVVNFQESLILRRYNRRRFVRAYVYNKDRWLDIQIPAEFGLGKVILDKVEKFQLTVQRIPDSRRRIRQESAPIRPHYASWTSGGKGKKAPQSGGQCRADFASCAGKTFR